MKYLQLSGILSSLMYSFNVMLINVLIIGIYIMYVVIKNYDKYSVFMHGLQYMYILISNVFHSIVFVHQNIWYFKFRIWHTNIRLYNYLYLIHLYTNSEKNLQCSWISFFDRRMKTRIYQISYKYASYIHLERIYKWWKILIFRHLIRIWQL